MVLELLLLLLQRVQVSQVLQEQEQVSFPFFAPQEPVQMQVQVQVQGKMKHGAVMATRVKQAWSLPGAGTEADVLASLLLLLLLLVSAVWQLLLEQPEQEQPWLEQRMRKQKPDKRHQ